MCALVRHYARHGDHNLGRDLRLVATVVKEDTSVFDLRRENHENRCRGDRLVIGGRQCGK